MELATETKNSVTVVVPTLNEQGNIEPLVRRIDASMRASPLDYCILFIDDNSSDKTLDIIVKLSNRFPIDYQLKRGERGKAQSIIQGFKAARTDYVCMIDADLQYPPEAIPSMTMKLINNQADVALSSRLEHDTGIIRKLTSKGFHAVFVKLLYGINYDTQSGLKVFKRSVLERMHLTPSPWSFDLEFIVQCLTHQKKIITHDIVFGARHSGYAKVNVISTSYELAKSSLSLRMRVSKKQIKRSYRNNVQFNQSLIGII